MNFLIKRCCNLNQAVDLNVCFSYLHCKQLDLSALNFPEFRQHNLVQNLLSRHRSEKKCSVTVFMVHWTSWEDSRKTPITGKLILRTCTKLLKEKRRSITSTHVKTFKIILTLPVNKSIEYKLCYLTNIRKKRSCRYLLEM